MIGEGGLIVAQPRKSLLLAAMVVLTASLPGAAPPSGGSPLSGRVTSADGKTMEGVGVTTRESGKTFTTTVYTDETGRYAFPPALAEGRYSLWAQTVGFQRAVGEVALSRNTPTLHDFSLTPLKDFSAQLNGDELIASLPGDSPAD